MRRNRKFLCAGRRGQVQGRKTVNNSIYYLHILDYVRFVRNHKATYLSVFYPYDMRPQFACRRNAFPNVANCILHHRFVLARPTTIQTSEHAAVLSRHVMIGSVSRTRILGVEPISFGSSSPREAGCRQGSQCYIDARLGVYVIMVRYCTADVIDIRLTED
jgi:hypothetical protein